MNNPFGPPVAFPANVNDVYNDAEQNVINIIHDTWHVVYSWPGSRPAPAPQRLTLGRPTILQSALFKCRCRAPVPQTYPVTFQDETDKIEVKACELLDDESSVAAALDRTTCPCRSTPVYEKVVVLPINEKQILVYQRLKDVQYTAEDPNTCLLLVKEVPVVMNIGDLVGGMDIAKRRGAWTFGRQG